MKRLIAGLLGMMLLLSCSGALAVTRSDGVHYFCYDNELADVLAPAFAGEEWAGWTCTYSQYFKRDGRESYAQAIMQKGEKYTLCCLIHTEDGWVMEVGYQALFDGRKPTISFTVDDLLAMDDLDNYNLGYDLYVWYENGDQYHFFAGTDHWRIDSYQLADGTRCSFSDRTLYFSNENQYVYNTQPLTLGELDISKLPKSLDEASEMAKASPDASKYVGITYYHDDTLGMGESAPLIPLYLEADSKTPIMLYFDGIPLDVMTDDDDEIINENSRVMVRIGTREGWMPLQSVLIGEESASQYPFWGNPGVASIDYPGQSIPFYEQPDEDSTVIGELRPDEYVRTLGITQDGAYLHIIAGEDNGYISSRLLTQSDNMRMGIVNNDLPTSRLNLREKPSKDAPSLGRYYSGTEVEFLYEAKTTDGWRRVKIGPAVGYMMSKYLTYGSWPNGWLPPTATLANAQTLAGADITLPKGERVEILAVRKDKTAHVLSQSGYSGYLPLSAVGGEPRQAVDSHCKLLFDVPCDYASVKKGDTVKLTGRSKVHYERDENDQSFWCEAGDEVVVITGGENETFVSVPTSAIEGGGW